MSTSERLQAEYLTCSQCTNPFHQPKTLPCLHNFCKACLSTYLENEMSGGKSTTFKCPDCREKIYVPDPSKAVNRWASQFPTNFVLTGMIEAIADETEGEGPNEERVKAAKERRGGRADDHSPARQPDADETDSGSKPNATPSLQERLTNMQDSARKNGGELSYYLQEIETNHRDQIKRLEMSFKKIQELIESRKIQLIEELEENYSEEKQRIQQAKQSYKHDLESLSSCGELLAGLEQKSLSKNIASDMLDAIQEQVREIEIRPITLVPRSIRFEQKLEAGRSILNLIENLGSVTISTAGEVDRQAEDVESSLEESNEITIGQDAKVFAKPKFLSAISAKSSKEKTHQIYGITVMQSGSVIMTSYGENSIQAARDMGDKYVIFSCLELDSELKCIVAISQHYVAVVGKFCVYIVGVTAEKLILKQTVQTGKSYTGIAAYSESSLIMTCHSPPCLDFVALNGFISETVDRDLTTNTILFKDPQFITTSQDGVIYIIDQSPAPKLLSINNAGKVRFTYPTDGAEKFQMPQGVACDRLGHIYVVDRGAQKVTLLTPAGEKVKDVLTKKDGLTDPCAIAIDKNDNIYVTNDFSEVLIFQTR